MGAENQWSLLAEVVEGNFTEEGLEGYRGVGGGSSELHIRGDFRGQRL